MNPNPFLCYIKHTNAHFSQSLEYSITAFTRQYLTCQFGNSLATDNFQQNTDPIDHLRIAAP